MKYYCIFLLIVAILFDVATIMNACTNANFDTKAACCIAIPFTLFAVYEFITEVVTTKKI